MGPFLSFPFLSFALLSFPFLCFPFLSFPFLSFALLCFPFLSFPLLSFPFLSFPFLLSEPQTLNRKKEKHRKEQPQSIKTNEKTGNKIKKIKKHKRKCVFCPG